MYGAPRARRGGAIFENSMSGLLHRRRLLLGLAAGGALALAGCGRKGRPLPPPDADPKSPRRYPIDKSLPEEYRNVPPEFAPPPTPPAGPRQGPSYPVQPGTDTPFDQQ